MADKPKLRVLLCAPRGSCAGVTRAIDLVEMALKRHGAPVYVRHEIIHNKYVVDSLKAKGAVFVRDYGDTKPNPRSPAAPSPLTFPPRQSAPAPCLLPSAFTTHPAPLPLDTRRPPLAKAAAQELFMS